MSDRFKIVNSPVLSGLPPPRIVFYGQPKVGKTYLASLFPKPILVQTEDGAAGVRIPKIPETPCESWEEVIEALTIVLKEDHDRQTLIIDTLDKAEQLAADHIREEYFGDNREKYMAYNKGPKITGETMTRVLKACDLIRKHRGMNIVLIAHDGLQPGANALGDDFKKWAPNLGKETWTRVRDWADQIGHIQSSFRVVDGKAKEIGKDRWIYFLGSPGRDAGCRVGYEMPDRIKLNWDEYQEHMGDRLNGI